MSSLIRMTAAVLLTVAAAGSVVAQAPSKGPGQGPVVTQCKDDIAKFCADKKHDGEVRACLETKKGQVTAACKTALDTTGAGKGRKQ